MAKRTNKNKKKQKGRASRVRRPAKQTAGTAKASKTKNRTAKRRIRGRANSGELVSYQARGLGARSGGQAGDTQGISAGVDVDSESVEELLEEGQSFEAEVVNGVENAPDADEGEVRTREVSEDDVPEEYRDRE